MRCQLEKRNAKCNCLQLAIVDLIGFYKATDVTHEHAQAKKHGETRSKMYSSVVTPPRFATAFSSSI